jgi:translation initiation factor 2 subunit 3
MPGKTPTRKTPPAVEQAAVNIGLVGHVDHGKTSLTQALSGKWTDTHSEELKRGISIKLGYAEATFYKIKKGNETIYDNKPPTTAKDVVEKRVVSFVDAPGHETLMTTMLSGAALMEGAVLVIAANETCPQPQTEEHLMALKISGIKNIVIAQNKIDLTDKKQALKNLAEINALLKKYGFSNIPIIPISANFGGNIDYLIQSIQETIPTPKRETKKTAKMYCSRSFDINKPGTGIPILKGGVFGGSITHGTIKVGDEIEIAPGIDGNNLKSKVVSLSTDQGQLKEAHAGGLIAVGTELDPSITQSDRMRGQVLGTVGSLPKNTKQIRVEVEYLDRVFGKERSKIKTNDMLVLTVGTTTLVGRASIRGKTTVELELNNPSPIEKGDTVAISKKEGNRWRLIAYGNAA